MLERDLCADILYINTGVFSSFHLPLFQNPLSPETVFTYSLLSLKFFQFWQGPQKKIMLSFHLHTGTSKNTYFPHSLDSCECCSHSTLSTVHLKQLFSATFDTGSGAFFVPNNSGQCLQQSQFKSQYFVLPYLPAFSFPKNVSICFADFNTSPLLSFRVTGLMSMS